MIPGGLRGRDHKSTFDQRGSSYHLAMTSLPNVRAEEFRVLVARAELRPGHAIVDLPSGGGYLHRYLPEGVTCLHVETSQVFHAAAHHAGQKALLASSMGDVPLASGSVDRVLSLAGLHHETDRLPLYREAARLLRPGGLLLIAEVAQGSSILLAQARSPRARNSEKRSCGHRGPRCPTRLRAHRPAAP